MKIAMLTSTGERCGVASYTRALVAGLETLPGTTVAVVPITEGKQPKSHYVEQAELLNAPDIDVVHIQHEHGFWGGILPGKSAYWDLRYLIQKPLVLTAHTTYSLAQLLKVQTEKRPLHRLMKNLLIKQIRYRDSVETAPFITAMTLVHTAAARREIIGRGADLSYIQVMPTGIPAALPAPFGGAEFRAKHNLVGRRIITLFGYITPNKGYELTLDALSSLPEDVVFVIAGGTRVEGEKAYADSLRARVEQTGLAKRVVITGFLSEEEVPEAMAASDLVVVPHLWATGSYSVALPLTHGRPILASDVDCFQEIQARADCLELFPAGDLGAYRAKLLFLLSNEPRRTKLSEGAKLYAEKYSWNRVAAMTLKVYTQTIGIYSKGHKPVFTGTPHKYFKLN